MLVFEEVKTVTNFSCLLLELASLLVTLLVDAIVLLLGFKAAPGQYLHLLCSLTASPHLF